MDDFDAGGMMEMESLSSTQQLKDHEDGECCNSSDGDDDKSSLPNLKTRLRGELKQFISLKGKICGGSCRQDAAASSSTTSSSSDSNSTFSLQDPGTNRIIDIASSFHPTGFFVVLWKLSALMWAFSVICVGVNYNARHSERPLKYFMFFSNWGTVFSVLYMICSFVNSAFAPRRSKIRQQQLRNVTAPPSFWIRLTWILFEVAAQLEIAVSVVYWTFNLVKPGQKLFYRDIMTHGVVCILILIDGLVVNRIPVRLSHYWQFNMGIILFYVTLFQDYSELGNRAGGLDDYAKKPKGYKTTPFAFNLTGKLTTPVQDHSLQVIRAAITLHVLAGVLILVYRFVSKQSHARRKVPMPMCNVISWKTLFACWCFIWLAIGALLKDGHVAHWLEIGVGILIPTGFLLFLASPIFYMLLYGLSLASCWGCSGGNRRYLPDHATVDPPPSCDDDCEAIKSDDEHENSA